jgi:hypothetical protein
MTLEEMAKEIQELRRLLQETRRIADEALEEAKRAKRSGRSEPQSNEFRLPNCNESSNLFQHNFPDIIVKRRQLFGCQHDQSGSIKQQIVVKTVVGF